MNNLTQTYDTIVIGAGQAGLSTGYFLKQQGRDFVILDANERVGDSWRQRWDSLRLFTPARYNGLVGMPFPAHPETFPTKDEMGDFLESYAEHFDLPVELGLRVERLAREGDGFVLQAGERQFAAKNVVVAMANYQKPHTPDFAEELDQDIVQIHSGDYCNPSQLQPGAVLIVGAGNSGSEIGMELARQGRRVWMSGRDVGQIPFRIESNAAHLILIRLVIRFLFHRVLTVSTPIGRKIRPKVVSKGGPLIRVKRQDMEAAGIERVPKMSGARDGRPVLEDGRVLDVANVVWCTGFHPGFSWIDLPVYEAHAHEPRHERGVATGEPGLYFVGLHFQSALSSAMVHGVERDARYVAQQIAARSAQAPAAERARTRSSAEPSVVKT